MQYADQVPYPQTFSAVVGEENSQSPDDTRDTHGLDFAIEKGQLVALYLDKAYLACADTGNANMPALGIATKRMVKGEMGTFAKMGQVRGCATLTKQALVYLSNTPGEVSVSAGDTAQIVGYCYTNTDEFDFNPDVTVAASHTAES